MEYICANNCFTAIRYDEVIAKIKWCSFFVPQCTCLYIRQTDGRTDGQLLITIPRLHSCSTVKTMCVCSLSVLCRCLEENTAILEELVTLRQKVCGLKIFTTLHICRRSFGSQRCLSVCLSVCHSLNCDKTNESSADILIPHEKQFTYAFGHIHCVSKKGAHL